MAENLGNRSDNKRRRHQDKVKKQFTVSYDEPALVEHGGRDYRAFSTEQEQFAFFEECKAESLNPVLDDVVV